LREILNRLHFEMLPGVPSSVTNAKFRGSFKPFLRPNPSHALTVTKCENRFDMSDWLRAGVRPEMWKRFVTIASVDIAVGGGVWQKPWNQTNPLVNSDARLALHRCGNVDLDGRSSWPWPGTMEWRDFRRPLVHNFERHSFAVADAIPTGLSHGEVLPSLLCYCLLIARLVRITDQRMYFLTCRRVDELRTL
jgi:hypothetical protein